MAPARKCAAGPRPPAETRLDCRGLLCPLPVLEAEKALKRLRPPFTLIVIADDPAARIDFEAFAWKHSLDLVCESPRFTLVSRGRARRKGMGTGD